ncbi:hypothetical protein SLOPH_1683 [Spraguea lophii 42_110]|uniref:Uncharacterized protein n=1 Tax=Spraguea lophii (strain 42_110) TaxID=1358809 RepID=S7XSM1_SPRLO|nr:hypothetical protein SLOPH_1683 [Spraguea lophii 42_110]
MNFKRILSKILKNEDISEEQIIMTNEIYSSNELVEDLSLDSLYTLTQSLIIGIKTNNIFYYKNFFEELEHLQIVDKKFIQIKNNILEGKMYNRDDKIFVYEIKQNFKKSNIDWESRYWAIELLKYLYIKGIDIMDMMNKEKEIQKYKDIKIKPKEGMKVVQLTDKNIRTEIFRNRNNPTMTLEEFSDKIMKNIEANKEVTIGPKEVKEESLEELRKWDEFKDNLQKGNTYRRG